MLWVSSLQIILGYIQSYFETPSLSSVHQDCNFAYDTVLSEKTFYKTCVQRQTSECSIQLDKAVNEELLQIERKFRYNENIKVVVASASVNCAAPADALKSSVGGWVDLNYPSNQQGYTMMINRSCSTKDIFRLKNYLSETAHRDSIAKPVSTTVTEYLSLSTSKYSNLAQYTKSLLTYDEAYIGKSKTQSTNMVNTIGSSHLHSLNNTLTSVYGSLDQLIACSTLTNKTCLSSRSAIKTYNNLFTTINDQNDNMKLLFAQYQTTFDMFAQDAITAAKEAQSLLSSIHLLVQYIIEVYGVADSPAKLCGKVKPDWCEFMSADFKLDIPLLPSLFPLTNLPRVEEFSTSSDTYNFTHTGYSFISNLLNYAVVREQNMLKTLNHNLQSVFETENTPPDYSSNNSDGLNIDREAATQENKTNVSSSTQITKSIN